MSIKMTDLQTEEQRVEKTVNGVTVRKELRETESGITVVVFTLMNGRDDEVAVDLDEPLPEDFSVEKVGLHPEYNSDRWTVTKERLIFEAIIDGGEGLVTLYGVDVESAEKARPFLTDPQVDTSIPLEDPLEYDGSTEDTSGSIKVEMHRTERADAGLLPTHRRDRQDGVALQTPRTTRATRWNGAGPRGYPGRLATWALHRATGRRGVRPLATGTHHRPQTVLHLIVDDPRIVPQPVLESCRAVLVLLVVTFRVVCLPDMETQGRSCAGDHRAGTVAIPIERSVESLTRRKTDSNRRDKQQIARATVLVDGAHLLKAARQRVGLRFQEILKSVQQRGATDSRIAAPGLRRLVEMPNLTRRFCLFRSARRRGSATPPRRTGRSPDRYRPSRDHGLGVRRGLRW